MKMEEKTHSHILEIQLISAQGLKAPASNLRRMQTYALAWVDSSAKLRTAIDRFGGENPTWNDKFLFQISPDFISSETSGVSFEIYAVACLKDVLLGSARLLLSSCPKSVKEASDSTPAFMAVQIQRPSGRFQGVLNIGAAVYRASDFDRAMLSGAPAISFRNLMGKKENLLRRRRLSDIGSMRSLKSSSRDSSASSSSNSSSSNRKGKKENSRLPPPPPAGKKGVESPEIGSSLWRRFSLCPLDQNMGRIVEWADFLEKEQ